RAIELAKIFDDYRSIRRVEMEIISDLSLLENEVENIDLIVNCTPMGMDGTPNKEKLPIPSHWSLRGKTLFEMVYNPVETKFLKKGIEDGAVVISGIDMLINQAASSFKIWFDIMPETSCINDVKSIISKIQKNSK
ncbi:MAG: hypothetical protein H5T85_03340, partial [Actinobacteria bacterium]|nr:hypothetical protein [Actinomycetota bacterium]